MFLLFVLFPFVEIYLLIRLAKLIGGVDLLLFILGTGVLGLLLMRRQGSAILQQINLSVAQRQLPAESLSNGFFSFVGGLLLLAPGVLTDILGVSLLFPPTRFLWKKYLSARWNRGVAAGKIHVYNSFEGFTQNQQPSPVYQQTILTQDSEVIDIQPQSSQTVEKKDDQ